MRILAWFLFVIACIVFLANIQSAITEKIDSTKATQDFWRALFTIPTVVFFIIFLFF